MRSGIISIITDIKNILEDNKYRRERYAHDILWLDEHKNYMSNNIIRIAIMGITSSGKSTLVNAILGEELLPRAIKPSSSIIINCFKDSKRKATVYFENKEPLLIQGEDLNSSILKKYADESENENNILNVTQIDISSPKFLFGENIHIIDSPGLDACDLDIHERITMEVLLPTIDICIFLTTVKSNSDQINVEKISLISKQDKYVILVQNMIDSVEPKIGKNGIIEESKSFILEKHKRRAEHILKVAINQNKDIEDENFGIVQISAFKAFEGLIQNNDELIEKSNIKFFINEVNNCIANIVPKLNQRQALQLANKIDNIISTDDNLIVNKGKNINTFNTITKLNIDDVFLEFKTLKGFILSEIGHLDDVILNIIDEIKMTDSKKIDKYTDIIEKINKHNIHIEEKMLSIVKKCENKKNILYDKLGLDIRYSFSLPRLGYSNVDVMHKYEEKINMVEKDGVLNKGKRFFSNVFDKNWGYQKEILDQKVIDKEATISQLQNVCNVNRVKYINIINEWSKQYTRSINLFYNEITKKEKDYITKKDQNIHFDDIKDVSFNLIKLKENIKKSFCNLKEIDDGNHRKEISVKSSNNCKEKDNVVERNIPLTIYDMYAICNNIIQKNYSILGDYVKNKTQKKLDRQCKNIYWVWDAELASIFINRMSNIFISPEEIKSNCIHRFNNDIIIYEDGINKVKLYQSIKSVYGHAYNFYLIFNAIQISNSEKQIRENLNLREFVTHNYLLINLVVDSFREFVEADNIKEMLLEVEILKEKLSNIYGKDKVGYIFINDKNPIYNMALLECQEKEKFIISDYKNIKNILLGNSLCKGREEKKIIEDILMYFLSYRNKN